MSIFIQKAWWIELLWVNKDFTVKRSRVQHGYDDGLCWYAIPFENSVTWRCVWDCQRTDTTNAQYLLHDRIAVWETGFVVCAGNAVIANNGRQLLVHFVSAFCEVHISAPANSCSSRYCTSDEKLKNVQQDTFLWKGKWHHKKKLN